MTVINRLEIQDRRPWDEWPKRLPEQIHEIIVHRFGIGDSAHELDSFFATHPDGIKATGGVMAYHFTVNRAGEVEQALELEIVAPHAAPRNTSSIGIAVLGDFRSEPPTDAQLESLQELLRLLSDWVGTLNISRHTAVGSHRKDCPGEHLDLEAIVERLEENRVLLSSLDAERQLIDAGVTL